MESSVLVKKHDNILSNLSTKEMNFNYDGDFLPKLMHF